MSPRASSSDTEGSSERTFSAHGLYSTPLRHALGPEIASKMTRCKSNHDIVFAAIKDKIWARYQEKYRGEPAAFTSTNENYDSDN